MQRVLESMRPFIQALFGSKGFVIEATTDKPLFSDNSVSSSWEGDEGIVKDMALISGCRGNVNMLSSFCFS